ncbi:hypothetical protein Dsin_011898 [Dipteronia sinensis]|uniref:DUF4283 domain-containing protein n=1 Tax=Dipteronia sinensis TaxID=43782 RepID=A0AAE0E7F3_9ROSI|nr:hypothetical protein Dsin_011898 [Dipteronia sinensis]
MVSNSMDPMSVEASLYVSCSAGSRVVPSRRHVSLRPHGGKVVDDLLMGSSSMFFRGSLPIGEAVVGGVEPLVGSSLPTSSIRGSSFADLFKAAPIQVDNVSGPSILSKRVVMWLFGWIPLLRSLDWRFASFLSLVGLSFLLVRSLGSKGYFQIMLNSDAENNMVWSLGSLNLKLGVLRLQPWIPDFNPSLQKSSNAQVWVRFYDLSWESWHPNIIFDLARGIGVPLRLDMATIEGDFGHFTCVLVDIDVSTVPPSSLLLERDDSRSSFISVEYENLPAFCSTCSSIGHFPNACRWNKSSKEIPVNSSKPDSTRDGPVTTVADEGFQVPRNRAPKMVFHPISGPRMEVPVSNVFAAIQQDLGALDSVVVHSSAGSDPVLSTVSSTGLVASPGFTYLVVPTTSVVAAQTLCEQQSGSVNAIVPRSSAVVSVSNVMVVHDSPMDIGSDLSVDLSTGQASSFSGSETILKSSTNLGMVFDVHSTVSNHAVPVIDSLVQTAPTIMGSFSLQRPSIPHAAHGVRNDCPGSFYISSSVAGSTHISGFPASDSQAELRLIAGSSWSSQTEAEGLDASNISQRTTMITRRLTKLKSKIRTSSCVSDD